MEDASMAWRRYQVLKRLVEGGVIRCEEEAKYLDRALKVALSYNVTVYDALYIAQALERAAPLLTSDRKQAQTAKKLGVRVYYLP